MCFDKEMFIGRVCPEGCTDGFRTPLEQLEVSFDACHVAMAVTTRSKSGPAVGARPGSGVIPDSPDENNDESGGESDPSFAAGDPEVGHGRDYNREAIIDSGASSFITSADSDAFDTYTLAGQNIETAKRGQSLRSVGVGTLPILVRSPMDRPGHAHQVEIPVESAMRAPSVARDLYSVSSAVDTGVLKCCSLERRSSSLMRMMAIYRLVMLSLWAGERVLCGTVAFSIEKRGS